MTSLVHGGPRATAEVSDEAQTIFDYFRGIKRVRRQVLAPLYRIADSGWLGLTPLRTHILICGFPRSGTTLLQMMLENGLPQARRFGREVGGWRAATYCWRNHPLVVSKVPHDVMRLEPLRNFYGTRRASLRILLMIRDPRDVLTSRRLTGGPGPNCYCVSPQRWRRYFRAYQREHQRPDVLVIRYEDLVHNAALQQSQIEAFTGERMSIPFGDFHAVPRPDFDTSTLNGLRPVEPTRVARWAAPEHQARVEQILSELPELPDALEQLGYEPHAAWCGGIPS